MLTAALGRVPALIPRMAALPPSGRAALAEQHADTVASGADVLWASEKAAKKTADDGAGKAQVATAIAEGLAILACRPDGAGFGGLHWHHAGHEDCPGPGELALEGMDRRQAKGAYYTPRFMAEHLTLGALDAKVYRPGPLDHPRREEWKLIPSPDILDLRIGDIACGSGVFLLAAVRYLAGRLAEAWQYEADGTPPPVWPQGVFPPLPDRGPLVMAARRAVIRCVYGIDIDQTAVEFSRLALQLMAPAVPAPVDLNVVHGDSLLGIASVEQLVKMHIKPEPGMPDLINRDALEKLLSARAAARTARS